MQVGIDIVEVSRIQAAHERYGEHFLNKILTEAEIILCMKKSRPYESIAARFASKEAISKALGTGISKHLGWHSMEILNDELGKPVVTLKEEIPGVDARQIALSLSHTHNYAVAVALINPNQTSE
ncbi:MAG: holo-ACP synthase [Chlorobiales bacterium]|nr:holo-ACP synthase [Chlorobiales bacterium]